MWIKSICVLLAGFAITVSTANAQTFESPINITYSSSYDFNSCAFLPQQLVVDYTNVLWGPAVVFRINQRPYRYAPMRPWLVTKIMPTWPGVTDLAIWVCRNHVGNILNQCVDGSDNGVYGGTPPDQVTVPASYGSYYVVVTTNIDNAQPNCGQFTLQAFHF